MDESREALKSAHRMVRSLDKQITDLESAAERAQQAADGAAAELAKHADLDKVISRWRVAQLKKAGDTKKLPEDLKARIDAKRAAEEELQQTLDAQQTINEELKEYRDKLQRAQDERTLSAIAVLHRIAEGLAAELQTIAIRRVELLQLLRALIVMKIPDHISRQAQISPIVIAAMRAGDSFAFLPNTVPSDLDEVASRWSHRLAALLADPGAAVTVPRHVEPSDYTPGTPGPWQGPGHALPGAPTGSWKPEAA